MNTLLITPDVDILTTEYFSRDPSEWDSQSYLANILKHHPGLEPAKVNSSFYTSLRKIVASASSSSVAIGRAQLLIDQSMKNNNEQPQGFVNHGTVHIAPYSATIKGRQFGKGQHLITLGSRTPRGTISVEHTRKRRRLGAVPTGTPKRTLSEIYDEDEEDEYEDENEELEGEDEDEEEEEEEEKEKDQEECSIPSDKHDGLNFSDTNASGITTPANTSTPPYSSRLEAFLQSYTAMSGADKQTFTCSGRLLEDVIHACVTADPATAEDALDWVIDLESDNIGRWFSTSELDELDSWLPPTPKVDRYFTYARQRYEQKSNIGALRETSESKPTPPDTPYNRRTTFNATYLNVAVATLLSTIEQSATNGSVGSSPREGWYISKIWSTILDHCLDDLDNFTVSRTDIASKVGCQGRRFEAVFLAGGVGVHAAEVGAVELPGSGKRHGLRELMKAMVKGLWKVSKCGDEAGRKLQVVGVQHVGFHIRISTMCAVSRGVFVLQPGKWRTVPRRLEDFESVFDVLRAVVVMKEIVRRTLEVLRAHANVETGEDFAL